jgi:hypothetical protein
MEFVNGDAELNLAITGLLSDPNISGTMKIYDTRYRYPVKMHDKSGGPADIKDNYARHINWDVKIYGGENNYFFNDDYMNTSAQVYLKFGENPLIMKGKGNDVKITGIIGIAKGTYKYMNTDFSVDTMKESKATFDGLMKPIIDVYATTTIRGLVLSSNTGGITLPGLEHLESTNNPLNIKLHAWGRVGDIKMDVSSEPVSLNRDRLLYIITFGKDSDKPISADDATNMATQFANAWIKSQTAQISKILPGTEVIIKVGNPFAQATQGIGDTLTSNEGTTRLEAGFGTYITDALYVNYMAHVMQGRSLIDPNTISGLSVEHSLGIEYSLDPTNKLIFEGTIRDPNYYSNQFEAALKIQTGFSFDSWGAKPTPTPARKK